MMANVEQIGLEEERQRKGERRQTAQLALCQQYQDMSTERNLPLHCALTLVAVSVLCVGITCEDIQFPGWNTEFYLCHTSCWMVSQPLSSVKEWQCFNMPLHAMDEIFKHIWEPKAKWRWKIEVWPPTWPPFMRRGKGQILTPISTKIKITKCKPTHSLSLSIYIYPSIKTFQFVGKFMWFVSPRIQE